MSKFVKDRVYVFIDAANIFYTQRTLGWKISYEKLMKYFKRKIRNALFTWLTMKINRAKGNF